MKKSHSEKTKTDYEYFMESVEIVKNSHLVRLIRDSGLSAWIICLWGIWTVFCIPKTFLLIANQEKFSHIVAMITISVILWIIPFAYYFYIKKKETVELTWQFHWAFWVFSNTALIIIRSIAFLLTIAFFFLLAVLCFMFIFHGSMAESSEWFVLIWMIVGLSVSVLWPVCIFLFIDKWICKWHNSKTDEFEVFFHNIENYHSLSPLNDPLFAVEGDMTRFLEESEKIRELTSSLIHKRRLAWFVFTRASYRDYKNMIHKKLSEMIPLLEKQRIFLGEKITREQEKLTEAKQQVRTYLTETGDNTLEQTAEVQRMRLERHIEEFQELRAKIR